MSLRSLKPLWRMVEHGVLLLGRQPAHLALDDRPEGGQHQGQRRAQLVVDVGEELGLELVEGLELEVGFLELGRRLLELDAGCGARGGGCCP